MKLSAFILFFGIVCCLEVSGFSNPDSAEDWPEEPSDASESHTTPPTPSAVGSTPIVRTGWSTSYPWSNYPTVMPTSRTETSTPSSPPKIERTYPTPAPSSRTSTSAYGTDSSHWVTAVPTGIYTPDFSPSSTTFYPQTTETPKGTFENCLSVNGVTVIKSTVSRSSDVAEIATQLKASCWDLMENFKIYTECNFESSKTRIFGLNPSQTKSYLKHICGEVDLAAHRFSCIFSHATRDICHDFPGGLFDRIVERCQIPASAKELFNAESKKVYCQ
uniref:Uncharacterized protein n=1 Tax=Panagrolaimus sp. JU765 TaxID=591449 RepID=A0AC34Q240_9BILA